MLKLFRISLVVRRSKIGISGFNSPVFDLLISLEIPWLGMVD